MFVNGHLIPETIWYSFNGPLCPHRIIIFKMKVFILTMINSYTEVIEEAV